MGDHRLPFVCATLACVLLLACVDPAIGGATKGNEGPLVWQKVGTLSGPAQYFSFSDARNGWAVGYGDAAGDRVISRTGDGGRTWVDVTFIAAGTAGTALDLTAVAALGRHSACLVGFSYRSGVHEPVIRLTNDGGVTWTQQTMGARGGLATAVTFIDARHGWVAVSNADEDHPASSVFRTSDGGATWRESRGAGYWISDLAFTDARRGILVDDAGVAYTSNGGASWTRSAIDAGTWYFSASKSPSFVDASSGWIVAAMDDDVVTGTSRLYRTTDGGRNWTQVAELPGRYTSVAFRDRQNGFLSSYAGPALQTIDGGQTWFSLPEPTSCRFLFLGRTGWAVGGDVWGFGR